MTISSLVLVSPVITVVLLTSTFQGMVDIDDYTDERLEVGAKRNVRVSHFMFENELDNKASKMIYDIALLELEEPVVWTEYPHIR